MKTAYAILTFIGIVISEAALFVFFRQYGFDLAEFGRQALANPVAVVLTADVLLSSVIFWVFMRHEAGKYQIGHLWVFLALNLLIGLCAALPAFLYVRQGRIEQQRAQSALQS